jgi:malate dehydrogenase (oxaloacetate-decarboxylating)(NADP+)
MRERVRGAEYTAFVDEFVSAVQKLYPKCCIQWEDFANFNAYAILERYRDRICTYNDDIQGTAAVALAGLYGAGRINGKKLSEQTMLFLGGGAAATGIAELISEAMALVGLTLEQARGRNWLYDLNGLVTPKRTDLSDFQKPFAHEHLAVPNFVAAIESIRPTAIIGVSTVPKLFNQAVIEAMSRINPRPIIFPYSNPTSRSECTAQEAYTWSQGQAIFASGSPFAFGYRRRQDLDPRTGQQRLHLPGHRHGRAGHRGPPCHSGDVRLRRTGRGGAGVAGTA